MSAESLRILLRGGRVMDPARRLDLTGDVLLVGGRIAYAGPPLDPREAEADQIFDATGLVIAPGFIDLHCHLREPGQEAKETIATGTRAAARGGFTTVCAMANTSPPIDCRPLLEYVQQTARREGVVRVFSLAAMTRGLAGQELTEMAELAAAGAIAFSDDGVPIASSRIMRAALAYSRLCGRPIMPHCDDPELLAGGTMNEGPVAACLGLKGIPAAGEEAMVARDLALAALTGGRLHIAHVSTAGAVDLIRRAKARGVAVTAEATPHHLALTDAWVAGHRWEGHGQPYDTSTKVNPPLRSEADRQALLAGLRDGTIDAIATDHAPHTLVDKLCPYDEAAFGISGLETALGTLLRLVEHGELTLDLVIEKLTIGPARVFGLPYGTLKPGQAADVVVFDPQTTWVVDPTRFASKGRNTPLAGQRLRGRVEATFVGGRLVHQTEEFAARQTRALVTR